jgi:D-tyrosyl-tRNA(Tyr) deacylase
MVEIAIAQKISVLKMRAIIQRVSEASVTVDNKITGSIKRGLLVLLGIEDADTEEDIKKLSSKIANLRIFNDEQGLMNLSIKDINGDVLLVSQFTLFADAKKGNRPSYIRASKPPVAVPMYEKMIATMNSDLGRKIETGIFGGDMKVALINDGPVTIFIDTKQW